MIKNIVSGHCKAGCKPKTLHLPEQARSEKGGHPVLREEVGKSFDLNPGTVVSRVM